MKEIGVYIHFPFCEQKCAYCDFCSFAGIENLQPQYVDKLLQEIEFWKSKDIKVKTIYIGGGTPSVMPANAIKTVVEKIKDSFDCSSTSEITIECNPNSLTEEKLKEYISCGINRISLGVQSLNDEELKIIGRIHSSNQAIEAIKLLKSYNVNFSVDLMNSLPKQTIQTFANTLNKIIELNPNHISCYSLILEENTKLYKDVSNGIIVLPTEEQSVQMFETAQKILTQAGYSQYEVSNFSKIGFECEHNINYWRCGEYLGFGLNANSYFNNYRFYSTKNLKKYFKKQIFSIKNADFYEKINKKMKKIEFLMLGLRMINGIDLDEYKLKFNENLLNKKSEQINSLLNNHLIEIKNNRLKISQNEMKLLNKIILELI